MIEEHHDEDMGMCATDGLCEVEFIRIFRVDFGADDEHFHLLAIQTSKEIGRLNRGSSNIRFSGKSGCKKMAAHRVAVHDEDAESQYSIRFGFLVFVFRCVHTSSGYWVLKIAANWRSF